MQYDIFVSYASEDRAKVADPLVDALKLAGLDVWYAPFELKLGDSLLEKIERGIAQSKYGVLIVSETFLRKFWTRKERDALENLEAGGRKVVLPIVTDLSHEALSNAAPFLAARRYVKWDSGQASVVKEILGVVRPHPISQRRAQIERQCSHRLYVLGNVTVRAVRLVGAADECFTEQDVVVATTDNKYSLPPQIAAHREAILDRLEQEARAKGKPFFNGLNVRLVAHRCPVTDTATEKRQLVLELGPLDYFDYAVARQFSDQALSDESSYTL